MANIALASANKIEVVESLEQMTLPAVEAITAGAPVRIDTSTGKFTNANATTAAEARVYGIATKTVVAGQALTAIRKGVMDGFTFTSGSDYDETVWLSDTDGRIADAAGTVPTPIGRCVPGTSTTLGTAYDKLLLVDCVAAGATALETLAVSTADGLTVGGVIVPTQIEISRSVVAVADQIDQDIFIANRAYQVTAVREIHLTAESAGTANIMLRKCTGTQAPSAGTALLTNAGTTGFVGTAAASTVQVGTLTATTADLQLAAGNRLALDYNGDSPGELAGVTVTVSLKPI